MTAVAFLPSQVVLHVPLPLIGTMGRCEVEVAAAILVRACQFHGDRWQPVTPTMLGKHIEADLASKTEPITSLNRNPFARPDFHDLLARGYTAGSMEAGSPIEFTAKAFEALSRWVRP